jgi:hypothetical protein
MALGEKMINGGKIDLALSVFIKVMGMALLIMAFLTFGRAIVIYNASADSPFDYASTHTYWIIDPSDPAAKRHISPPILDVYMGQQFPLGRTLALNRTVYATIYKEIDCGNAGKVWPLISDGTSARILQQGVQDRISPSLIPIGPDAPKPGICTFNVWFAVYRNGLLPPLIVKLQPVIINIHPAPKGFNSKQDAYFQ